MIGKSVCYHHGGRSPGGIASATYKHGGSSKFIPARLQDSYRESMNDPNILSLTSAIALLQARFWDVLSATSQEESGALWQALHDHAQTYRNAFGKDAAQTRERALNAILDAIDAGYNERAAWQELRQITQEIRLLKESERKHLVDSQQMISVQQAMVMLGAVTHIIRTHVTDPKALDGISRELAQLVNAPPK